MEVDPWYKRVQGPFPVWDGPKGVKADGGGSIRGCGMVGKMKLHRAVMNRDTEGIKRLIADGEDVNEVEAAGSTPLHNAAYEGWVEGATLLLELGAKVNASNNAGDTPWHWATYMRNDEMVVFLEQRGASKAQGKVLVQEHVPKVKDFYAKECWAHHPKPYADYVEFKIKEHDTIQAEHKKAIRV
ncbi:MAG: hypothetical protein WDW38_011058 [Sanguina aurantia]